MVPGTEAEARGGSRTVVTEAEDNYAEDNYAEAAVSDEGAQYDKLKPHSLFEDPLALRLRRTDEQRHLHGRREDHS